MLSLESLRCFVAAAEHLNFRRAAKRVGLSPAAFSDRIRRLEEDLSVTLFSRSTRHVALTPRGERLLVSSRRCLLEAAHCAASVQDDLGPEPISLTVGTRYELGLSWLVPTLPILEANRPERSLHVKFGDTAELLSKLAQHEVDCAITSARIDDARFSLTNLHEERYVLVSTPELIAELPFSRPEHAAHHTLLDLGPELPLFRYFLDARPSGESWRFDRAQFLGTVAAVRARMLEGCGIGVLPEYFVREDVRAGRLKRLLRSTKLPTDWFRLVWRKGDAREADLHALSLELAAEPIR